MASDLTPEEREFLKSLGDTRGYQPVATEDPDEEAPAPQAGRAGVSPPALQQEPET